MLLTAVQVQLLCQFSWGSYALLVHDWKVNSRRGCKQASLQQRSTSPLPARAAEQIAQPTEHCEELQGDRPGEWLDQSETFGGVFDERFIRRLAIELQSSKAQLQ